jgi:hypothetical protein
MVSLNKKNVLCVSFLVLSTIGGRSLQATLTETERTHIQELSNEIKKTSDFIVQTLATLIEKKYQHSYRTFIQDFDKILDLFEQNVFRTIEERLEQTDPQSVYYQVIKEVYDLMAEAFKDIQKARATFDSYRNKARDAKTARECLKNVEPHLRALILSDAFRSLEIRLQKVYQLLEDAGEDELVNEIHTIETSLRSLENHPSFKELTQQTLKLRLANVFTRMFEKGT